MQKYISIFYICKHVLENDSNDLDKIYRGWFSGAKNRRLTTSIFFSSPQNLFSASFHEEGSSVAQITYWLLVYLDEVL